MKGRFTYFLFILGAGLFYLFYNGYLSFLILIFILTVPLISFLLSLIGYFQTSLDVSLDHSVIHLNEEAKVTIKRSQTKLFPVGKITFSFLYDQALSTIHQSQDYAFEDEEVHIILNGQHCGNIEIQIYHVYFSDYFNLISLKKRSRQTLSLMVMPSLLNIETTVEQLNCQTHQNVFYDPHHPGDDYSELFDMRPYQEGDALNRIHWKLSMKSQHLMVKEGSLPIDDHILLTFCLTHHADQNDRILSLFHSLATYLCLQEIPFDIQYKILRHPEVVTHSFAQLEQYEAYFQEMLTFPLEKEYIFSDLSDQTRYSEHYHVNECGISENGTLIGGEDNEHRS